MIEPTADQVPPPPPPPSAGPKVALALGVAVAVIAAGTVFVLRSSTSAPSLDERVPASAGGYVELNLRPGADQRDALDQILGRLSSEQRTGVTTGVDQMLDGLFSELDLSWQKDVKGWIGTRVVVSFPAFTAQSLVAGPQPVVLVAVTDEGAARASLERAKASTGGVFEIEDGVAAIAQSSNILSTFRADAERAPLAQDPGYSAERARHGDVLAFVWLNAGVLAQFAPSMSAQPTPGTVAFGLRAEPTAIVLEGGGGSASPSGSGDVPDLLGATSATLLGALTFFDAGTALENAFDPTVLGAIPGAAEFLDVLDSIALDIERDLAPWLKGEISFIVGGFSGFLPDAGLLIEVTNDDALDRFAGKLPAAAKKIANLLDVRRIRVRGDRRALRLDIQDVTVFMRRSRGRVAFATSERYANKLLRGSPDSLAEDAVYRRAVGDARNTAVQIFVRLDRVQQLLTLGLSSAAGADYDRSAGPLLGLFESAAMTAKADGRFRVVFTVAP